MLDFVRARELEAKYSLGPMIEGLERASRAGEIDVPDLELATRLINAALAEAALIGLSPGRRPSRAKVDATIQKLVDGLTRR